MSMCRLSTRLGPTPRRPSPRPAFTLIEMLVALAVMVLAMAMVTTVFSVTAKTTATSAAVSEAQTLARNFALQIEQDLRYCDPTRSVLVLVGRTQAAALTEDQRQAGLHYRQMVGDPGNVDSSLDPRFAPTPPPEYSDPRADILMFFTQRPSASQTPPVNPVDDFGRALQRGAKLGPVQVMYGHATLDRAVRSGSTWTFADDLTYIETDPATILSPLPLTRWHLARRAVIINDPGTSGTPGANPPAFDSSTFQRVVHGMSTDARYAGDAVTFKLDEYLRWFSPVPPNQGAGIGPLALKSPYGVIVGPGGYQPQASLRWGAAEINLVLQNMYPTSPAALLHHFATVVEQPPEGLRDNLALDLVPGCAWFQVEFLMPEDPRNSNESPLSDQRRDTPRWVSVTPGSTYVFVPDTDENRRLVQSQVYPPGSPRAGMPLPAPNRLRNFAQVIPPSMARALPAGFQLPHNGDTVDNRIVRLWPYAIRVTIQVIDHNGRLEQPIQRSVVHWFP